MKDISPYRRPSPLPLPYTTFHPFPYLPTEIRIQIWRHASDAPRLLELLYCKTDDQFLTVQHVPAVLHASKESREAALLHYHLSFGTAKHPPATYFNPKSYIIYFVSRQLEDERSYIIRRLSEESPEPIGVERDQDFVRKVAIAHHIWVSDPIMTPFVPPQARSSRRFRKCELFKAFPNTENLICVMMVDDNYLDLDGVEQDSQDYNGITLAHSSRFALRLHEKKAEVEQRELASKFANFPTFKVDFMVYGGTKAARIWG